MRRFELIGLLVMLTIQFIRVSETYPGTWLSTAVEMDTSYDFSCSGWSPKYQRYLVVCIEACGDTMFSLNVDADTYLTFYMGYSNNTMVFAVPSSLCDAAGNCNLTNYAPFQLSCTQEYVWITWDTDGNAAFGSGNVLNVNTILEVTGSALTEEANSLTLSSQHPQGATMYILKDYRPEFVHPAPDGTTSITLEERLAPGSMVYNITTRDPEGDSVEAFVWDLTDPFVFNGTELYTLQPLDYEAASFYILTIGIHDNKNIVNTTLTVRLQNVYDETPSVHSVPVSLPEEGTVGTYIDGGFTVSDLDEGDQLNYSLSGKDSSYLEITTDGRLKIAARIDLDPPTDLHLLDDVTLTVTDRGLNSNSTRLTFNVTDINDNTPVWGSNVVFVKVSENTTADTLLSSLVATDNDSGSNGNVSFTLVAGDDPTPRFVVEGTELKTSPSPPDYELLEGSEFRYRLVLQASDQPLTALARSAFATFIIDVVPVNEFHPEWIDVDGSGSFQDVSVSENVLPGHKVTTVLASDQDLGDDGHVTYSIDAIVTDAGLRADNAFSVNPITGDLTTSSQLDCDAATGGVSWYNITVSAADSSNSSRIISAVQRVLLENHNDLAPVFSQTVYRVDVSCETPVASVLLSLSAEDEDSTSVKYSLQSGANSYIRVYVTGNVTLLSYPESSDVTDLALSVVVEATDQGSPELKGTSTLLVLFDKCSTSTDSPTSTTEPCRCNETGDQHTTSSTPTATEATSFEDCQQYLNRSTLNVTESRSCKCNSTSLADCQHFLNVSTSNATESTTCQCNSTSLDDCQHYLNASSCNMNCQCNSSGSDFEHFPNTSAPNTSTPNTTDPTTCPCHETEAAKSPPIEEFLEAWMMRFLVMTLSAACLASLVLHCRKPKMPSSNQVSPQNRRMQHREATRNLDDLERHYLHR